MDKNYFICTMDIEDHTLKAALERVQKELNEQLDRIFDDEDSDKVLERLEYLSTCLSDGCDNF